MFHYIHYMHHISYLDLAQKWAEIVTAGSLIIALYTYRHQLWQDKMSSIADQISFFRKEITAKHNELLDFVKNIDANYVFPRINLDIQTTKEAISKSSDISKKQYEIIKKDSKVLSIQIELLNMLEELAIRVLYLKTKKHDALISIKSAYVNLVEQNMISLIMMKEVLGAESNYGNVLELYMIWKQGIDRTTPEEKMKKIEEELTKLVI